MRGSPSSGRFASPFPTGREGLAEGRASRRVPLTAHRLGDNASRRREIPDGETAMRVLLAAIVLLLGVSAATAPALATNTGGNNNSNNNNCNNC